MSKSNPYAPSVIQAVQKPKVDEVETAPDGSVAEVMAWVGDDADRAKLAYEKETAGNGRKSLLAKLKDLLPNEPEGDPAKGEPTVVEAEDAEVVEQTTGDEVDVDSVDDADAVVAADQGAEDGSSEEKSE